MQRARRILVLTLSFGSGHVQAARAIAREVKRHAPNAEVRLLDALADCRAPFRAGYVWPYWAMLRYAPSLWDRFSTARVKRQHEATAPARAFRFGCPKVFDTVENLDPDVIVAVEVAACEMAVIARRIGLTSAPILNVITDYEAEPIWVKPEINAFVVPDDNVRAELIGWGAPPNRIVIAGIPIDSELDRVHDLKALRLRHSISDDAPIVLLMGGGMGPTRMDQVAHRLVDTKVRMNIVAVAGKDKRVFQKLKRVEPRPPVSLKVLGWTDEVPALMKAAAVLVTKPGGLTIAEAAMCSLPTVFFDPIPGAELVNARRMVDAGAAIITINARETASSVVSLVHDKPLLSAMATQAKGMARPNARGDIARLALKLAGAWEEVSQTMIA